jgi:hypothetical protein
MMAWGTRVKGTRARSATCPVYDAFCPPKTASRTADAPPSAPIRAGAWKLVPPEK